MHEKTVVLLKGYSEQHSSGKNVSNPVTDSFETEDICGSLEDGTEYGHI